MTLDEACTLLCGTVEDAECDGASFCACAVMASYLVSEASTAAYEPMVQCLAQVDTTDLICTEDAPNPALDGPIFAAIPAEGVCEDEVCAFECAEYQSIYGSFSATLVARCGCVRGGMP